MLYNKIRQATIERTNAIYENNL